MIQTKKTQTNSKMDIIAAYQWFYTLLKRMQKKNNIGVDEINLVGGRRSGKSMTVQMFAALTCSIPKIKVSWHFLRAQALDAPEIFSEVSRVVEDYGIQAKRAKNEIVIGKNKIRVLGLNSQNKTNKAKKAGLANSGFVDYQFIVFEEAYEFDSMEFRAVAEAVRSTNKYVQRVIINIANPWTKSSPYISYCAKNMEWNVSLLKDKGSQFKLVNIPLGDGSHKRTIFQYTNWRVAKDVLPESDIKNILDTYNHDKRRALTTDLGLPGYEDGAIYTHLIPNIQKAIYMDHYAVRGGLDWGWGNNKNSSKTGAVFFGSTIEPGSLTNGIDIYGTYTSDNRVTQRGNNEVYREIIHFFLVQTEEYVQRNNLMQKPYLQVRVDYANHSVISSLNDMARAYKLDRWLNFVKCRKDIPVLDRIEIFKLMLSMGYVRMAIENCRPLIQELEFARYADIETAKRVKENDDLINALEYGLEKDMHKFARIYQNTNNLDKILKRSYNG